jgi:hypothetical protein
VRALAVILVVGLVVPAVALAARGDPQKKINPADQARAKAMLVRKSDLPGFRTDRSGSNGANGYCAALDESDLTVTGEADSPNFMAGPAFVSSGSSVYESLGDASASWKRGTSAAGRTCLAALIGRQFAKANVKLVSFRKLAFPHVARRTAAYRMVVAGAAQGISVKIVVDIVALSASRAQAFLFLGSAFTAPDRAAELQLARLVAGRMTKAMQRA